MNDWITETLSRPPLRVDDSTTPGSLQAELSERLEALLASHNGLDATAEGWRALALALALKHEPAFQIKTDVDRKAGRPAGLGTFFLRSMMRSEIRKGKTQSQAAKVVARRTKPTPGTLNNLFSRKASAPDSFRREKYESKAREALRVAADALSQ